MNSRRSVLNHAKVAAGLTDDELRARIAQYRANIAGIEVNGFRPQFYGMRQAKRADEMALPFYEKEAARRPGEVLE